MIKRGSKVKWILSIIVLGTITFYLFSILHVNFLDTGKPSTADVVESITPNPNPAPQYFYFNKDKTKEPKVSALAYVVGDLNTGEIILAKNADEKRPIASTSKLMTALVASELPDNTGEATVSKRALDTYGGNGNFHVGQKIPVKDLLYPLLLESSNDAAEVIAEYFNRDTFIKKMNLQAEKLLMTSTSYEDPSGLSRNNQSTPADLFKLAGYLFKDKPEVLGITTKRSYTNKNKAGLVPTNF